MPNCHFCKREVGEECFCYGCEEYICDECYEVELAGEKHSVEDHKYKTDEEFAVVND